MCQVSPNREVVVSTYFSLYKNSPQTLENCTSIVSSSYVFPDKDPHTYPSITFTFSVGSDVVWVYGVDETALRDADTISANYSLSNCGGGGGNIYEERLTLGQSTVFTYQGSSNNFTSIFGGPQSISFIGGNYDVWVSYGWAYDASNSDFRSRFFIDGAKIGETNDLHRQEPKDSGGSGPGTGTDQQLGFSRLFNGLAIPAGNIDVDLLITSSSNNVEASVWDVNLLFLKLS